MTWLWLDLARLFTLHLQVHTSQTHGRAPLAGPLSGSVKTKQWGPSLPKQQRSDVQVLVRTHSYTHFTGVFWTVVPDAKQGVTNGLTLQHRRSGCALQGVPALAPLGALLQ